MHNTMEDGSSHQRAQSLDISSAEGFRKERKDNRDRYCRVVTRLGTEKSH